MRVLNEGITQLPQGPTLGAGKPQGKGKAAPKTKGGTIFQKPTLEEVAAYCQERGNDVDPQAWIDYYTSNGWKVGRNCMKDWRAAVRTWERNEKGIAEMDEKDNKQGPQRVDLARFRAVLQKEIYRYALRSINTPKTCRQCCANVI